MLSVNIAIPTRNEEENISNLLSQLKVYKYEVIVVDDSDDATADIAVSLGARVVKGKRKGLGQAIIDGINASKADVVVVMDADGCLPFGTKVVISTKPQKHNNKVGYNIVAGKYSTVKSIQDITIGDEVLSYNEQKGKKEWDIVVGVSQKPSDGIYLLGFSNGNELKLTGNHKIYVHNKGWVRATGVNIGASVIQYKYKALPFRVYNLTKRGELFEALYGSKKAKEYKRKIGMGTTRSYGENPNRKTSQSVAIKKLWANKLSKYHSEECETKRRVPNLQKGWLRGKKYEDVYDGGLIKKLKNAISVRTKKMWQERRDELIALVLQSARVVPNKTELLVQSILNEVAPDEFRYNDGWFILGEKVPDFVNINGKKKIIEFQGCFYHRCPECGYGTKEEQKKESDKMKQRASLFATYGYETRYIWEHQLRNIKLLKKELSSYIYNPNTEVVTVIDKVQLAENNVVYDIETKKNHNFFAYGILVHNSHSPLAIPSLLKPILEHGCDLCIGSRYVKGGDFSNWELKRQIQSIIGVKLMQLVTGVKDSNSGFFAFRKSILDGVELKPLSWKIMLEVLFRGKWISKQEVPITFSDRSGGVSKNSNRERIRHAIHLLRLLVWKFRRYIKFACVGGIGALWYFGLLYFLTEHVHIWYGLSAIIGTLVAITNNYFINHYYTFRKERQHNTNLFKGWLKYIANSALGDGADWCMLILLTEVFGIWYMLSAFLASGVASVIKYTIAKKYIWGKKGRSADDADYEWLSFYKGLPWQKYSKQNIAKVVKKLAGDAGVTVDCGCGSSPLGILTNHTEYIGIDVNEDKMAYMNNKHLANARFVKGSVLNLSLPNEYADTVLFIEAIEHLDNMHDVNEALDEIKRILKPDGKVIIAMPDFSSLAGRIMERLYGVFHPQAYADEHKVKMDVETLEILCRRKHLILWGSINLLKRDVILSFRK